MPQTHRHHHVNISDVHLPTQYNSPTQRNSHMLTE